LTAKLQLIFLNQKSAGINSYYCKKQFPYLEWTLKQG